MENQADLKQDDVRQIAQLVIELDSLRPYYHANEIPDRKPLVILQSDAMRLKPTLSLFGQSVQYISQPGTKPFFEFTKIAIDPNDVATVTFRYPVEGIEGNATLRKSQGRWKIETQSIAER